MTEIRTEHLPIEHNSEAMSFEATCSCSLAELSEEHSASVFKVDLCNYVPSDTEATPDF